MKIKFFWNKDRSLPTDRLDAFAEELFHSGVSVLVCGGGVTAHPREAIAKLTKKYIQGELIKLSMELLFEVPFDKEFPEGATWVAQGIIYHLGDKQLTKSLIKIRQDLLTTPPRDSCLQDITELDDTRLECLEELLAGLCGRLKLPYPERIEPLDPQMEMYLFLS
ncbi:MAG: hypothetical protein WCI77_01935 [Candidatus Omnitrophota bacterium]